MVWYLESLQSSLQEDRWREAVFGVRRWKKEFLPALPGLAQRLDRLFYDLAVRKANPSWMRELTTAIDPPPWDPRWNRAWALIVEDVEEDIEPAEVLWLAYVEDLVAMPDLKPAERTLAQAMIWERLGRRWAKEAADQCDCDTCRKEREEEARANAGGEEPTFDEMYPERAKIIECFNKATGLAPGFAAPYHALADQYVQWKQEDAAAQVLRRLAAHVPDDFDAIVSLFHYHHKRDEFAARDYALRACRLKPASEEVRNLVVAGHFLAARTLALQGRWDDARAELAAVAAVGPGSGGSTYDLMVQRAMVEFKAGQPDAGWRFMEQALSKSDDPANVHLALAIEALRYELPFQLGDLPSQFSDRWQSSLKKRRSRAAGAMSRRLWAWMEEYGKFSEKQAILNDFLERVVKYVSGATRIRWQADDLLSVCRFLERVVEDPQFREVRRRLVKFLDSGRKKFPQDPEFHVRRGQIEMRRGPSACNRRLARQCFEMAIETAKPSSSGRAKEIQQLASQRLSQLDRAGEGRPQRRSSQSSGGFARPGVPGSPPPEFFAGRGPREEILEMIKRMAASKNADPQDVIDEIMGELFSSATKGRR